MDHTLNFPTQGEYFLPAPNPLIQIGPALDVPELYFDSDTSIRNRYFVSESYAHPAKLHLGLLAWLVERYTQPGDFIIDPMAGIGSTAFAALLQRNVLLRDVEDKWLELARQNAAIILREGGLFAGSISVAQHDARRDWGLVCEQKVDAIITSPPYGCSMSAKANRRAGFLSGEAKRIEAGSYSERWTQLLASESPGAMGSELFHYGVHPDQIGHWRGKRYWLAMTEIYQQALLALKPGGLMVLVLKDHIKDGEWIATADQTIALCLQLGFVGVERHRRIIKNPSLWQRRRREQGLPIVGWEDVLVFSKQSETIRENTHATA